MTCLSDAATSETMIAPAKARPQPSRTIRSLSAFLGAFAISLTLNLGSAFAERAEEVVTLADTVAPAINVTAIRDSAPFTLAGQVD